MSSALRVSVGRFFDRVARPGVSRARAVAPAAPAALVPPAARRPVRGVWPLVVLVSVAVAVRVVSPSDVRVTAAVRVVVPSRRVAAAVVRGAFPLLVRVAVVVVRVALPLSDVPALARPPFPSALTRPAVPPPVPLVFDPLLLVATANLLARLPALWRRRRPLPVMYPQVVRS